MYLFNTLSWRRYGCRYRHSSNETDTVPSRTYIGRLQYIIIIIIIIITIIIIIIIEKGRQLKAGRERFTPYQSKTPAPQY